MCRMMFQRCCFKLLEYFPEIQSIIYNDHKLDLHLLIQRARFDHLTNALFYLHIYAQKSSKLHSSMVYQLEWHGDPGQQLMV